MIARGRLNGWAAHVCYPKCVCTNQAHLREHTEAHLLLDACILCQITAAFSGGFIARLASWELVKVVFELAEHLSF